MLKSHLQGLASKSDQVAITETTTARPGTTDLTATTTAIMATHMARTMEAGDTMAINASKEEGIEAARAEVVAVGSAICVCTYFFGSLCCELLTRALKR
jgi:hypothetical protein